MTEVDLLFALPNFFVGLTFTESPTRKEEIGHVGS